MLHDGLKKRSAAPVDKSMSPQGGSVNDNPTRKSVGESPKTLGPRTA